MLPWDSDSVVQVGPESDSYIDWFHFLKRAASEHQFLVNALVLELFEVRPTVLRGAELVRDQAMERFNKIMRQIHGREWFLVFYCGVLQKDRKKGATFFVAGNNVLASYRCQIALANIVSVNSVVLGGDGRQHVVRQKEEARLECALAPPFDDNLKVLPLKEVAGLVPFNH